MTSLTISHSYCRSNVGQKAVMAVTGAVLFLFIIGHLAGNMQMFAGRERINAYAAFLKNTGELLWVARGTLLLALTLHIIASAQITLANWRARPVGYAFKRDIETTYAAKTMILSGPLILLYVIYHLMMFNFLVTGPGYSQTDVYGNVIKAFQTPAIAGVYILAMLMLGLHLSHGIWSMLHTLGISNPRYHKLRRIVAPAIAAIIAAGYISIPLAALIGVLKY